MFVPTNGISRNKKGHSLLVTLKMEGWAASRTLLHNVDSPITLQLFLDPTENIVKAAFRNIFLVGRSWPRGPGGENAFILVII